MAINFPSSPTTNQEFTSGGTTWIWDGTKWGLKTVSANITTAPVGTMLDWPVTSGYPTGYLRADGSAISRSTYAGLFTLIGTTYGSGDGSTTFNLPNIVSAGTGSPVKLIKVLSSGIVEPSTVAHAATHTEGGSDVITVSLNQVPNYETNRNILINGNMAVAQRNSGSVALTNGVAISGIDRWWAWQSTTAAGTVQRITTSLPPKFFSGVRIGRNSGATTTGPIYLMQVLETSNSVRFQNSFVTMSFWAKAGANFSASSNIVSVQMFCGRGTDQSAAGTGGWTGLTIPIAVNQSVTTSWVRYIYTGFVPSDVTQIGAAILYTPTGTAGADDNMYITGVQMELGSIATPFEFEPLETTLRKCQRYFYRVNAEQVYSTFGFGFMIDSLNALIPLHLPVEMRIPPNAVTFSAAGDFVISGPSVGSTCNSVGFRGGGSGTTNTRTIAGLNFGTGTAQTTGIAISLLSNNRTTTWLAVSAEL